MSNLLLFLFTTLVDFVILLLLLRVFSSFWVSTNNQIHQSIILMTNSILNPLRSNLNNKTFIYVVLCVCLLIKFFTLWLMTKFACLIGPNFFQLVGLSIFSLLRFVLNILFFTINTIVSRTLLGNLSFLYCTPFKKDYPTLQEWIFLRL